MLKKSMLILAFAAVSIGAQAQTASKKALIDRILKAQQPGIEAMATQLAEEPALELRMRAAEALPQRVAQDKQQAVAKDIEADLKKYADEVGPIVRAQAIKLAPSTVGTMLDQKFTEEELRALAGIIESPTYKKFQQVGAELQGVLSEKLVAETRASVTPKVKALEESIAKRLGVTPAK